MYINKWKLLHTWLETCLEMYLFIFYLYGEVYYLYYFYILPTRFVCFRNVRHTYIIVFGVQNNMTKSTRLLFVISKTNSYDHVLLKNTLFSKKKKKNFRVGLPLHTGHNRVGNADVCVRRKRNHIDSAHNKYRHFFGRDVLLETARDLTNSSRVTYVFL